MADNTTPGDAGADTGPTPTSAPAAGAADATTAPATAAASMAPPQWKRLARMGTKRTDAGGLFVNDHQFLVMGGYGNNRNHLSSCEYYDTRTQTWKDLSMDLPTPLMKFGVAHVGNRVFVMGGTDKGREKSDLHSTDLSGGDLATLGAQNWESLAPMNQARYSFACVAHQQSLYVFGGRFDPDVVSGRADMYNILDTAERYDTTTNQWTPLPPMPGGGREFCAAGVVGNRIFVVGGRDKDRKTLASTIVFDTSTQQWESSTASGTADDTKDSEATPAVPNMKTPRSAFSVVVVERFVIAIGDLRVKTVEVLDTQRNAWNVSPKPMEESPRYFVAGFCKETNEIIVAGGSSNDKAWSIPFETGLLPLAFRLKERGQKVEGDKERGKDHLGMELMAEALAELIIFKDLIPPFAVGFLGRWGRGKSFFFNLILDYIIKIQKKPADKFLREAFAGHIFVVMFNAWTFSKGDIWSSLMFEILKTLNEQLQFEEKVGQDNLIKGVVSTLEVFRDFSKGEIEYMQKHKKVWEDFYKAAKKDGDCASERLLEAINVNYEEDKKALEETEKKIQAFHEAKETERIAKETERAAKETERIRNLVTNAVAEVGKIIVDKTLKTILRKATEKNRNDRSGSQTDSSNEDDETVDELIEKFEDVEDYNKLIKDINNVNWRSYKCQWSEIPLLVWICSAVFLLLALTVIYTQFQSAIITTIATTVTTVVSGAIPYIKSISMVKEGIDPLVKEFKSQAIAVEDIEVGNTLESEELRDLEQRKSEIKNRVSVIQGESLKQSIDKIDATKYEGNLGIVHQIHQDLQAMTEGMMNERHSKKIFPRGEPRILLFVDDLDRCDKKTVVEVIEALQLLVKTKLFVAVLAIDPRYVTSSLEVHYKGILHPRIPPTGMDFLEKIIQIPFRLPGVEQDYVHNFVASQIQIEEPQDKSRRATTVASTSETASTDDNEPTNSNVPGSQQEKATDKPGAKTEPEGEPLPSNKVAFSKEESIMIQETLSLFGVGPRCMRRIINVFKLLQVIWKRDTTDRFEKSLVMKRATLFVMLLASEELTREAAYAIFEWMEMGTVGYHNVASDPEDASQHENNLAKTFKAEILKRSSKNFELSFDDNRKAKEGTLMAHIENYLAEFKWSNVKEWKDVSSKFLLARSFSFFRLVPEETGIGQHSRMDQGGAGLKWHHRESGSGRGHNENSSHSRSTMGTRPELPVGLNERSPLLCKEDDNSGTKYS